MKMSNNNTYYERNQKRRKEKARNRYHQEIVNKHEVNIEDYQKKKKIKKENMEEIVTGICQKKISKN